MAETEAERRALEDENRRAIEKAKREGEAVLADQERKRQAQKRAVGGVLAGGSASVKSDTSGGDVYANRANFMAGLGDDEVWKQKAGSFGDMAWEMRKKAKAKKAAQ